MLTSTESPGSPGVLSHPDDPTCHLLERLMKTPLRVRATALVVAVMLTTVLAQALALFALPPSGDVLLAQAATAIHRAQ